jgi:hypothetical protein
MVPLSADPIWPDGTFKGKEKRVTGRKEKETAGKGTEKKQRGEENKKKGKGCTEDKTKRWESNSEDMGRKESEEIKRNGTNGKVEEKMRTRSKRKQ